MSIFRTELTPQESDIKISLNDPLLTIGSCFSDSMGNKLNENKFKVQVNPFGVIYNPISIHRLLDQGITRTYPEKNSYIEHDKTFFNFHFHSRFSSTSEADLTMRIREAIDANHDFIKKTNVLIITYGTAFVFERTDTKEIVANCHKVHASKFDKRLLEVDEILSSFEGLHETIRKHLSVKKVVLTVSPVRHIKDTLEQNGLSKAVLRLACQKLTHLFTDVDYFPSYEIMMDDLRDYRFYKNDMIHPTEAAEDYIWEKFSDAYFDRPTFQFLKRWYEIRKALSHRPFHPENSSHQQFLKETLSRLEEIKSIVSVEEEMKHVKSQLNPVP